MTKIIKIEVDDHVSPTIAEELISAIIPSTSYQLNMLINDQNSQPLSHCAISNQGVAL